MQDARGRGVDAWGWLPSDSGREPLMEYASRQPGAHVLVPDGDPDLDIKDLPQAETVPTATG